MPLYLKRSFLAYLSVSLLTITSLVHAQATGKIMPISVMDSGHIGSYIPQNTLDNNFATRWTAHGIGQYVQYDFGAAKKLSQIKIAWEKPRDYTFDILVSANGTTFSRVGNRRKSTAAGLGLESFDVSTTGRYVRVVDYGYTGQTYISITEIQFYGAASSPSSASSLKWHPGHYVWPVGSLADTPSSRAGRLKFIDTLALEPQVEGIQLIAYWGDLEGDTPGDYSKGFAMIDEYLAKLESLSLPKRLMIGVQDRVFASSVSDEKKYYPGYVVDRGWVDEKDPNAGTLAGSLYSTAMSWKPEVMDRLIALTQAYAARYNQQPLVEMFSLSETSLSSPSGHGGFSVDAYGTQLKRWCDRSKSMWTHTQLRLVANFHGKAAQMRDLIESCAAGGGLAVGGPDPQLPLPTLPLPDRTQSADAHSVFRGADGGTDLRGIVPWVGEQQGLGLGQRYTELPADILNFQANGMHASYMIWLGNTYLGGAEQRWSSGILPLIRTTDIKLKTTCPVAYQGRCDIR